jgi:hypothetical protein
MLKKAANFVLGSSKSSTYPRGYASGFDSPAALLDGLFEHPAWYFSVALHVQTIEVLACQRTFSTTC